MKILAQNVAKANFFLMIKLSLIKFVGWGHIYKKPALLTSTLLTGFFFIFNCGQSKRPLYFKM